MAKSVRELLCEIRNLNCQIAAAGNLGIRGGSINGMDPSVMRYEMQLRRDQLKQEYVKSGGDPEEI